MNSDTTPSANGGATKPLSLKVIALGGAGGKMAAKLSEEWHHGPMLAVDSDEAALAALALAEKFQLGRKTLRGLGTGGDFEHARGIADAELESLEPLCTGADVIVILCGLGKGIGTGVAPLIAQLAKKSGALVLAFAALPFEFEGARRSDQAQLGLAALKAECDGVICLPNHALVKLQPEDASLVDTFRLANALLADGARAIARLLLARGLIDLDFAQFRAVFADRHSESVFATAEAAGKNRVAVVVEKILASPLLNDGAALDEASAVLVSIQGGPELGLAEVSRVMEPINARCLKAQVVMGAAVDEQFAKRLAVTLVVSRPLADPVEEISSRFVPPVAEQSAEESAESGLSLEDGFLNKAETKRPRARLRPQPPEAPPQEAGAAGKTGPRRRAAAARLQQGTLPFDMVSKGRFEKSEPTIYHGEDLDVPTYIRRGVALN